MASTPPQYTLLPSQPSHNEKQPLSLDESERASSSATPSSNTPQTRFRRVVFLLTGSLGLLVLAASLYGLNTAMGTSCRWSWQTREASSSTRLARRDGLSPSPTYSTTTYTNGATSTFVYTTRPIVSLSQRGGLRALDDDELTLVERAGQSWRLHDCYNDRLRGAEAYSDGQLDFGDPFGEGREPVRVDFARSFSHLLNCNLRQRLSHFHLCLHHPSHCAFELSLRAETVELTLALSLQVNPGGFTFGTLTGYVPVTTSASASSTSSIASPPSPTTTPLAERDFAEVDMHLLHRRGVDFEAAEESTGVTEYSLSTLTDGQTVTYVKTTRPIVRLPPSPCSLLSS